MNLEEIRKLSDEQLGKVLAETLKAKTKHFSTQEIRDHFHHHAEPAWYFDRDGGDWALCAAICFDLNIIAEVEEFIIGRDLGFQYAGCVEKIIRNGRLSYNSYETLTADARVRAEAALYALTREF